jgi:hypothetical protein
MPERDHVVEGLRRRGGRLGEDSGIGEEALGCAEGLVVEAIAAEHHDIRARIAAEHGQRVGKVSRKVPMPPGVERIPVARHRTQHACNLRAWSLGKRRQLQRCASQI